jgi:hypothetical protein
MERAAAVDVVIEDKDAPGHAATAGAAEDGGMPALGTADPQGVHLEHLLNLPDKLLIFR